MATNLHQFCAHNGITPYHLYVYVLRVPQTTGKRWLRDGVPPGKAHMVAACLDAWERKGPNRRKKSTPHT